ncbi:MAG: aldehyde dehydrogenase family protein, partial [Candidatus Microbacterium stercoravium]
MTEMFTAIDPTTGEVVREVPTLDVAGLEAVLARADEAYEAWRRWSIDDRARVLRAIAAAMRDDVERLAMLMTEEMGKPLTEARGEVEKA